MSSSPDVLPTWTLQFSTLCVTVHAWGSKVVDEFGAAGARLSVIVHENGAAFIAVVGMEPGDVLLLNFGRFWLASTCCRWTTSTVTYRAPAAGIYLIFSTAASLDQFEECCDRVLPANILTSVAPSVQDLYDLGIIPPPKIVGDFLVASSGFAASLLSSNVGSHSDATSRPNLEVSDASYCIDSDSDASSDVVSPLSSPTTLVNIEPSIFSLESDEIDTLTGVISEDDEFASAILEEVGLFDESSEEDSTEFVYQWFEL